MAITFGGVAGSMSDAASGSTCHVTLDEAIPQGAFVVVVVACDNTSSGSPTFLVRGSSLIAATGTSIGGSATAYDHVRLHHGWFDATLPMDAGDVVEVTLNAATTNRLAAVLWYETDLEDVVASRPTMGTNTSTSASSLAYSATHAVGDLVIVAHAVEHSTLTPDAAWNTRWSGTLGSGTGGVAVAVQDKAAESAGTLTNTMTAGAGTAHALIGGTLAEVAIPEAVLLTVPDFLRIAPEAPTFGQLWPRGR